LFDGIALVATFIAARKILAEQQEAESVTLAPINRIETLNSRRDRNM
jgi:hypothetical protein